MAGVTGRRTTRRSTVLAVGFAVVGVLALIAVGGLLAGCAHPTAGVATVAPNAVVSTSAGTTVTTATATATSVLTVTAAPATTTAAPPTTVTATATTVVAVPLPAGRLPGDLGLAQPITSPACDGLGIVIVKSAVTPGAYAAEVAAALAATPGSSYLRTDVTCPSLTPSTPSGDPIYAVYVPGGYSTAAVCAVVADAPSGSYGRWLSWTESPDHTIDC